MIRARPTGTIHVSVQQPPGSVQNPSGPPLSRLRTPSASSGVTSPQPSFRRCPIEPSAPEPHGARRHSARHRRGCPQSAGGRGSNMGQRTSTASVTSWVAAEGADALNHLGRLHWRTSTASRLQSRITRGSPARQRGTQTYGGSQSKLRAQRLQVASPGRRNRKQLANIPETGRHASDTTTRTQPCSSATPAAFGASRRQPARTCEPRPPDLCTVTAYSAQSGAGGLPRASAHTGLQPTRNTRSGTRAGAYMTPTHCGRSAPRYGVARRARADADH